MKPIMQKTGVYFQKTVAGVLSVIMLLTVLQIAVYAEGEKTDFTERFTADEIKTEGASMSVKDTGTLLISTNGDVPTVNMNIVPRTAQTAANALRIVMINLSGSNNMSVGYVFKNSENVSEYDEIEVEIVRSEEACEYIIPVKSPDTMTNLTLTFGGENVVGDIELVSVGAMSFCFDDRVYCGERKESTYYRDKGIAVFSGSVSYDTVLAHPNANIVLYELEQQETVESVGYDHPYVASCPMTLDFSFTVEIGSTVEACARYFAAVLTEDGSVLPIASECYLDENTSVNSSGAGTPGFKGVETDLYAFASGNGSSVAFVDVFLDKLGGDGTNGCLYLLDNRKEYYFNREYVEAIDKEIKSYRDAEVNFYLRFLIDAQSADNGGIGRRAISPKTKYVSIYPTTDEAVERLYACSDFIISRYAEEKNGSLMKGIVLGRSIDNAYIYNYCGNMPLSEYADVISRAYSIVKRAADKSGKALDLVLPFSGEKIGTDELMTSQARDEHYPSDILSDAVLTSLDLYGISNSSLCFMLEQISSVNLSARPDGYMSEVGYLEFSDMVNRLSAEHGGFSTNIIYCWFPAAYMTTQDLSRIYVYKYNYLSSKNNVKAFVISVFERNEYVDVGALTSAKPAQEVMLLTIKNIYRYIDTYRHAEVTSAFLDSFGITEWKAAIPDYVERLMIRRNVSESRLGYLLPEGTVGNYKMWDFASSNSTGGWEMSDGCSSLSVYTPTPDLSRSLVAVFGNNLFDTTGGENGSITYRTENSWKMDDISGISFDFCIYNTSFSTVGADVLFEVHVTVYADGGYADYSGVVKGGEAASVYADITRLSNVRSIKIGFKCLEDSALPGGYSVCFNNISMQSNKYDGDRLGDMILSGELVNNNESSPVEIKILIVSAIVIAAGVFVVLATGFGYYIIKKKSIQRGKY